jgi:acetolactate synthase-1/2/3 large subunit
VTVPAPVHHGGALLAGLLGEHGVTHVFGVPGGQTLALYDALLDRRDIRHVLVRDERTAAYAADGYARVSGRVGVCDATVGPGAAKLPSGLGESLGASVAVVALVSDLPSAVAPHRYRGAASQALDQAALLAPVTKWVASVPHAAALPAMVRHAFREATTGRPGPVALLLPQDVLDGPAPRWADGGGAPFGRFPAARVLPDPSEVVRAVGVLGAARRPFVLAGGGALHSGAHNVLASVAEHLSAAIATTMSGKGAVAETHPLAVGVAGSMGTSAARAAFDEADTVLVVGAKASGSSTFNWTLPRPDQRVVQLDIDPVECGRAFPLAAGMVGDARAGLEAVLEGLRRPSPQPGTKGAHSTKDADGEDGDDHRARVQDPDATASDGTWGGRVRELSAAWREERDAERASDAVPIAPQRVMGELGAVLREDDTVVLDASLASGWGCVYLEQRRAGRQVLAPRGFAGLGYALPAAMGVALARPRGRTVVVTGDGALAYALGEMPSVVEQDLPVTVVVLNNSSLGWIRWYRRITFGRGWERPDFSDVAFAAVAEAFGWTAARVSEPALLGGAIAAALGAEGPSLVDVVVDPWQTPIPGHRRAVESHDSVGYDG